MLAFRRYLLFMYVVFTVDEVAVVVIVCFVVVDWYLLFIYVDFTVDADKVVVLFLAVDCVDDIVLVVNVVPIVNTKK